MSWIKRCWQRLYKKEQMPNGDYLTRLDCNELNNLHHHARNVLIALRMQHRTLGNVLSDATAVYITTGRHLDRLENALRGEKTA